MWRHPRADPCVPVAIMRAASAPLALDARLAAPAVRHTRARSGVSSRIPRAVANNVGNPDDDNDCPNPPKTSEARERRKPFRLTRRTVFTVPPVLVAGAAWADTQPATLGTNPKPGEWGYASNETGPTKWGQVIDANGALSFPDCACIACAQSPIDITSVTVKSRNELKGTLGNVVVASSAPTFVAVSQKHGTPNYILETNNKNDSIDSSGGLVLNGVEYKFNSLHFHTPAENLVDGVANAMEMHLVHFSKHGKIAVLGVLFKHATELNKPDKTVESLLSKLTFDGGAQKIKITPNSLWDSNSGYYSWQGSLTTPPCSGDVAWVLQKNVCFVSSAFTKKFREHLSDGPFPGNARPVQQLNGRTVLSHDP